MTPSHPQTGPPSQSNRAQPRHQESSQPYIGTSACTVRKPASAESSRCNWANCSRSVTVETAVVPAGPYARAVTDSTGTAPPAVTSCPDTRRSASTFAAKIVSPMPALARSRSSRPPKPCPSRSRSHAPARTIPRSCTTRAAAWVRLRRHRRRAARAPRRPHRVGRRSRTPYRCAAEAWSDSRVGLAGSRLRPAIAAELREVRRNGIIQRQPAGAGETSDHSRDHRLGQRSNAEE